MKANFEPFLFSLSDRKIATKIPAAAFVLFFARRSLLEFFF
jgi:hypothetical protein